MKDEIIPVSDFTLATYLASVGITIDHLDRTNKNRVYFCFKVQSKEAVMNLIDSFWKGETKVEPKHFHGVQKNLKSRIYNEH